MDVALSQDCFHVFEERVKLLLLGYCLGQRVFWRIIHECVPLMKQEHESNLFRSETLEHLLNSCEVLETFAHLFSCNMQMAGVPEVVNPVVAIVKGF